MTAATAVPQSDFLLLRSGAKLPLVGFGTYKVDKADSVRYAIFLFHADYAVSCRHTHLCQIETSEALAVLALCVLSCKAQRHVAL